MPENQVYIPQRMNVQMPATQERPGGHVRTLQPGWLTLDEELSAHPVISQLVPRTEGGVQRQNELAQMHNDVGTGNAHPRELAQLEAEHQKAAMEERNAAIEDWNSRANAAADRGEAFYEPHPDPEVERARALTAQPAHAVPTAGLAQKPHSLEEPKKTREALQSQEELENEERRAAEEGAQGQAGETEHHGRRRAKTND